VNHVKSGIFFASKRNEIFTSISNFASEAKVRALPNRHISWKTGKRDHRFMYLIFINQGDYQGADIGKIS
jgi:hypothetical protein